MHGFGECGCCFLPDLVFAGRAKYDKDGGFQPDYQAVWSDIDFVDYSKCGSVSFVTVVLVDSEYGGWIGGVLVCGEAL